MSVQTFVDECKAGGFSLAAASIPCQDVPRLRAAVNSMRLPTQVRIHFVAESAQRRKSIMSALVDGGGISAKVYDARRFGDSKEGRDKAVARMAADQAAIPASRIVLETDDSAADADQVIIRQQLDKAGVTDQVGVDHMRARDEPLLAIPDALAWCFTKVGEWWKLAEPLIADVVLILSRGPAKC